MKWSDVPWTEIVVLVLASAAIFTLVIAAEVRQRALAPRYDTFSSYDAHSGGYRAWYELLARMGNHAERFTQRSAFLDRSIDTLIVAANSRELALRRQDSGEAIGQLQPIDLENIRSWVKQGGRLIWLTDGDYGGSLGVPTITTEGQKRDDALTVAISPLTAGVARVSGTSALRARFASAAKALPLVADDSGAVVMEYRLGKGSVAVITDQSLFDNARITKADNARLAYNLATGGNPKATVAFDEWVHGFAAGPTWWAVLPVPARAAVIIAAAALLLLVIGTALRFGPTSRLPEVAERTSAEYLASMAHLLARGKAARKALRDLADLTLHEVAASAGLSERASAAELAARLESYDPERAGQVRELDALRKVDEPSDNDLVRAARLSCVLRKELTGYGRIGFGRRETPLKRTA